MKISRALIISKKSALERLDRSGVSRADASYRKLEAADIEHERTMEIVEAALSKKEIECDLIRRNIAETVDIPSGDYDIAIAVGGDGTLLSASHYIKNTPMLGVLSSHKGSLGMLCGCDGENFEKTLDAIIGGKRKYMVLQRLEALIDGKPLPKPALNDVLFAHSFPASTARYVLSAGKKSEEQKSSGIWISTAAGSTAAGLAAGGKPLPIESKNTVFVVREPFHLCKGKHIESGTVKPGSRISIKSGTLNGCVFIDGQQPAYPVEFGQTVTVRPYKFPIKLFGYSKERRRKIISANLQHT